MDYIAENFYKIYRQTTNSQLTMATSHTLKTMNLWYGFGAHA